MTLRSIITLANSIIGVSILAMPFCFKQCGIVLATLMLVLSGLLVKITCHLLLKSAILARRRNYELLAFQTFGPAGKLAVEVCMIGFLMGTQIAFFVVMGDLAPPIIANLAGIEPTAKLRLVILVGLGLFVALPLALLRNVDSLAGLCTASLGFYLTVLLYIVLTSWGALAKGDWTSQVNFWRPAGVFQCLPIFCMGLSCQPQVFEIYDALPDPSSSVMNDVVRGAVNLCSGCYICVGIFGYITFSAIDVGGNILAEYPPTLFVEILKLGFVLSVAVSFPLVVFPCRTAIHSLVFRKGAVPTEMASNYIPPDRFNAITVLVLLTTLTVGILIPDIEFVLGMVGSTIGSAICTVFPAVMFVKLTSKNTTERVAAQTVFFIGVAIMVLGTYVNLYEANRGSAPEELYKNPPPMAQPVLPLDAGRDAEGAKPDPLVPVPDVPLIEKAIAKPPNITEKAKKVAKADEAKEKAKETEKEEKREEPVEPKPPEDDATGARKEKEQEKKEGDEHEAKKEEEDKEDRAKEKKLSDETVEAVVEHVKEEALNLEKKEIEMEKKEALQEVKEEQVKQKEQELEQREKKAETLIKELEKQKDEHKQLIEEQKEVLKQMKEHVESNGEGEQQQEQPQQQQQPLGEQQQLPAVQQEQRPVPHVLVGEKAAAPPAAPDLVQQQPGNNAIPQQQYQQQQVPVINNNNIPQNAAPQQPVAPLQQQQYVQQPQQYQQQQPQQYQQQQQQQQQQQVPQQQVLQQQVQQQQVQQKQVQQQQGQQEPQQQQVPGVLLEEIDSQEKQQQQQYHYRLNSGEAKPKRVSLKKSGQQLRGDPGVEVAPKGRDLKEAPATATRGKRHVVLLEVQREEEEEEAKVAPPDCPDCGADQRSFRLPSANRR